jgi:hypothetical protein
MSVSYRSVRLACFTAASLFAANTSAQDLAPVAVEGQPLAANVRRLQQALDYFGAPLPPPTGKALQVAGAARDAAAIQRLLDPHVLLAVTINPEARVKVARGPAKAILQQATGCCAPRSAAPSAS